MERINRRIGNRAFLAVALIIGAVLGLGACATAEGLSGVNTSADGLALRGFDAVAYHTAAAAVVGNGGADIMVLDLTLPDLDTTRLREALGEDEATPEPLEAVERRQIAAMLRHTRGNRRRAAQLLGLARSTLLAKIRRYGLETAATRGEE